MIGLIDIEKAERNINEFIHRTPVITSSNLNEMIGCQLFFKCENFQKTGSFKIRGAVNAVMSLSKEQLHKGVATHSSGNHAQALAYAAKLCNVPAYIVIPENASRVKIEAVVGYGAEVFFCAPTLKDREEGLKKVVTRTGARFIPPFDDDTIIAGQATAARELLSEISDIDWLLAPVGGGGLLAGTTMTAFYANKNIKVVGCEPEGAGDAFLSFRKGAITPVDRPTTIADGLLTTVGTKNFEIIGKYVKDIWMVNDDEIKKAMKLVWERMKIVIEPSSAVPLAAAIKNKENLAFQKVGIILSGGNIDVERLLSCM